MKRLPVPILLFAAALLLLVAWGVFSAGEAEGTSKASICHPVNGKGETGTGWNLISPAKASSHIDEATGAGKHTSHDGRTDVYAVDGKCPGNEPPPAEFEPYEVDVCWTMSHTDGVEGTYEWPQTRGCQPPACGETVEQQHDTYWIRDRDDEEYLAGLTGLNSPADDARLEPHGYYSTVLTGEPCVEEPPISEPPSPTPTPTAPPTPTEPPAPSEPPTVTTPPVPTPPITTPPVEPPVTMPPVVPGEPKTDKPPKLGPPAPPVYMACVRGAWVTVSDGKVISRSGTCNPGTPPVPIGDVREEGF